MSEPQRPNSGQLSPDQLADWVDHLHRAHEAGGGTGPAQVPADLAADLDPGSLDELEGALRTVSALRGRPPAIVEPPAELWSRIDRELHDRDAPHAAERLRASAPMSIRGRRRRPGVARPGQQYLAAAAAAGILVGGLGVGLTMRGLETGGASETPPPAASEELTEVVARADLEAVDGGSAVGSAVTAQTADGDLRLQISAPEADMPETGYLEVWLRDESADRMVPLGALTSSQATLPIPGDLQLGDYPVVDVSHEPLDGDPGHSGDSLWLGMMQRPA